MHDSIRELDAWLKRQLVAGFRDEATLVEEAAFHFGDDARPVAAQAFRGWAALSEPWPERTDCDRLDEAFAALEAEGIVARQDFTCCSNCGFTEMRDELIDAEAAGMSPRGFVFFHRQDTDGAIEGGELNVRYSDPRTAALAAAHLARTGLETTWAGDPHRTIEVRLSWKRRAKALVTPPRRLETEWAKTAARELPRSAAQSVPLIFGDALVEAGFYDEAARWADAAISSSAQAVVARALLRKGEKALATERLLAGYRLHRSVQQMMELSVTYARSLAPSFGYVDLLVCGGVEDPEVLEAAQRRVSGFPWNLFTAAARAWLLCALKRAGKPLPPGWIEDALVFLSEEQPDYAEAPIAHAMLSAALWELEVVVAAPALEWLATKVGSDPNAAIAERAIVHAAIAREASESLPLEGDLLVELLRALPRERAATLANTRRAWLALGDKARADAFPDTTENDFLEGLIDAGERAQRSAEVLLADPAALPAYAEAEIKLPEHVPLQPGSVPRASVLEEQWASLQTAEGWRRYRPVSRLLKASLALIAKGDSRAGAEIFDRLREVDEPETGGLDLLRVTVLLALGRLEDAFARRGELSPEASVALARALVEAGRGDDARALLLETLRGKVSGPTIMAMAPLVSQLGGEAAVREMIEVAEVVIARIRPRRST